MSANKLEKNKGLPYYEEANRLRFEGQYRKAIDNYQKAIPFLQEKKLWELLARCYIHLAFCSQKEEDFFRTTHFLRLANNVITSYLSKTHIINAFYMMYMGLYKQRIKQDKNALMCF